MTPVGTGAADATMASVAMDPFEVALGDFRDLRGARRVVRRGVLAEDLVADVDSRVPAGSVAVADVTLEAFDGGVAVTGRVSGPWEGECRRCLCSLDGEFVAEVREIFRIPRIGAVAGCYVRSGVITRGSKVRFLREGVIIWKGAITSLRRFKEDVREVHEGFECGIGLSNNQDLRPGDIIETYEDREIPRT